MLAGVFLGVFEGALTGIWTAVVGGFLFSLATTSHRDELSRERKRERSAGRVRDLEWLKSYRVRDVVLRPQRPMLSKETPLSSPLVAQALAGKDDCLIVLASGQPEGVVTRSGLARVPVDARSVTPLAQVAVPLASFARVALEDTIFELVMRMETEGLDRVAVAKRGVLLGFISRWDVMLHLNKIRARTGP